MSGTPSANSHDRGPAPGRKPRSRLAFSMGALFSVLTAICLFQAYRTNRQIAKYYTPAPAVNYNPQVAPYAFRDDDFVDPLDPRPATALLQERVQTISARIAELNSRGNAKLAADMQTALDKVLANREGPYPLDGTPQLHAIGIYDDGDPKDKVNTIDRHDVGDAHVRVTYAGAPIIVVLCAYDPVRWIVKVELGVQLKKVILAGHHRQQIQGIPDDVPIEGHVTGVRDRLYGFYACRSVDVPAAAERTKELTGLEAATFFTTHEYEGTPFVIGPGVSEWTASMTLRALDDLYQEAVRADRATLAKKLAGHIFTDTAHSAPNRLGGYRSSIAKFSVFGPFAETLQPLEQPTIEFAIDPRGPSFFGWHDGIVTIDPESGTTTPWPAQGVESHPGDACLAFDTKRKRLLIWSRDLVAVDILKKEAVQVCKGKPDVRAIAYCEEEDRIYACCAPYDGDSHDLVSEVRTYNHRGAELTRTKLVVPIPGGTLKTTMVGDKLLVMTLGGRNENGYFVTSDTNYVIDPKTGKLLFACKRQPR
jgi:hypothetical protein